MKSPNLRHLRRRQFVGALGLALLAPMAGASVAGAAPGGRTRPVTMTLPPPTGPYPVGTASLHLVDPSRPDPWLTTRAARELMTTVWYPSLPVPGRRPALQLPPRVAAEWQQLVETREDFSVKPGGADWAATRTHAVTGAPVRRRPGGLPVVLYSPGRNMPRGFGTVLAEELASRGCLVVAVDHTHETIAVEFSDGRVARTQDATEKATLRALVDVRVADVRFVLDRLETLHRGGGPDADRRPLPSGLAGCADLTAVGMFGHSIGGATAAQAMHDDPRIRAAVDLDGAVGAGANAIGSVVDGGLDRPFLLMNSVLGNSRDEVLATLWKNLRGWHRNLQIPTAGHYAYTDLQAQLPPIAAAGNMPADRLAVLVGTVDPARSVRAQRAYLSEFFDVHLRHRPDRGLFDGPSAAHPEVSFID
ncbi:alpha/beta hydrolase family protein [Streptomyces sp. NPDC053079]|uniref:alpha/beta hydrolase family protein n=1 Tax=Streptomyces sp. NPDC053079 TaxID=3365697 RepID=UPI0037CE2A80